MRDEVGSGDGKGAGHEHAGLVGGWRATLPCTNPRPRAGFVSGASIQFGREGPG
jgi:hypothetical protein